MRKQFQVPSKILHKLETDRENQRLYLELNQIKPTMSFSLPRELSHLKVNKKRDQIREGNKNTDRYTEIERENRILLEKINNIRNSKALKLTLPQAKQSLNFSLRAKNMRQISIDNLSLMKRLKSKRSFYDYGRINSNRNSSKKNNLHLIPSISKNQEVFQSQRSKKLSPLRNEEKVSVFSGRITLEDKFFSVEVFRGRKVVRVVAINEQNNEKYNLLLKMREAITLMGGSNDWEKIVECLHLDGDDLALWNESSSESI